MFEPRNPFRHLLNEDGTVNRAALMAEAWARYRADRFRNFGARTRQQAFGRFLRAAWERARQGQANEARRAREASDLRARIAAASAPRLKVEPVVSAWMLAGCATDGRLPAGALRV